MQARSMRTLRVDVAQYAPADAMATIWDSLGNLKAVVADHFSATEIMEFSAVCRFARSKGALKKRVMENAPADATVTIFGSSES